MSLRLYCDNVECQLSRQMKLGVLDSSQYCYVTGGLEEERIVECSARVKDKVRVVKAEKLTGKLPLLFLEALAD